MDDFYWGFYGQAEESIRVVVDTGRLGWKMGFCEDEDAPNQWIGIESCTLEDIQEAARQEGLEDMVMNNSGGAPKDIVVAIQKRALKGNLRAQLLLKSISQHMLSELCAKESLQSNRSVRDALFTCSIWDDVDSFSVSGLLEWAFPALGLDRAWVIPQERLVMHALDKTTGLVVNLGTEITMFASYEGIQLPECVRRSPNLHVETDADGRVVLENHRGRLCLGALRTTAEEGSTSLRQVMTSWVRETGVAGLIALALADAPLDCRCSLAGNIFLSGGGGTALLGVSDSEYQHCLRDVLQKALASALPDALARKAVVHLPQGMASLAVIGGFSIAKLPTIGHTTCILRDDFDSRMFFSLGSFLVPSERGDSKTAFQRRQAWMMANALGGTLPEPVFELVHSYIPILPEARALRKPSEDEYELASECSSGVAGETVEWWHDNWARTFSHPQPFASSAIPLLGLAN